MSDFFWPLIPSTVFAAVNKTIWLDLIWRIDQTREFQFFLPRLHGQANIKQTYSEYTCTTCALIARCLLDRVNGVLLDPFDLTRSREPVSRDWEAELAYSATG